MIKFAARRSSVRLAYLEPIGHGSDVAYVDERLAGRFMHQQGIRNGFERRLRSIAVVGAGLECGAT